MSAPILTIQGDDFTGNNNQESLAPPTLVSRFLGRPLIGQEGTRAASDWSALIAPVYCVVVPIR